jgi:hypothetical protein
LDLGEEKNWLRRLGALIGIPPFPGIEVEKDGELGESVVEEEAADRRGIAGKSQGEAETSRARSTPEVGKAKVRFPG